MTHTDLDKILNWIARVRAIASFFIKRRLQDLPHLCHVIDDAGLVGYVMGSPVTEW